MKVELIEKAAEIVGDNQLLINIVSRRVKQLSHGADPYVHTNPDMGSGDIALMEIIQGKLVWREMDAAEIADSLAGVQPEEVVEEEEVAPAASEGLV